jgi:hypothetical protein
VKRNSTMAQLNDDHLASRISHHLWLLVMCYLLVNWLEINGDTWCFRCIVHQLVLQEDAQRFCRLLPSYFMIHSNRCKHVKL